MHALERWHQIIEQGTTEGLFDLLHPDCVFWSPVVHTPQQGRDVSHAYLAAASKAFSSDFRYLRKIVDNDTAVLEFECTMDDIQVNGVDMIRFEGGRIVEFKVMIRPLKAVHKVHEQMQAMLAAMAADATQESVE